ncbi:PDR/VanB family oxidoreductase [Aeromicrobium sp. Root472D3]|uniref:PDR/VanB family oxidoreductase n=1 Tax=Aeromicrobium sp. Root472D3 TaxID=1736540 RepID=UPI0006F852B9|nr:PDR/VanB family oxidoreductase [Aeromicrobium sp. Root472D3]KQX75888.1 ferredoxin [Aeromicrobium sp. Root472D3]
MSTATARATNTDLALRVSRKVPLSTDVVEIVLTGDAPLPSWSAGAHLEVQCGDVRRQYSLCGDPLARDEYRIAVLREQESRGGSSFLHDVLDSDDTLPVSAPRNSFELELSPCYVFVAGGIGVTPIVTMVREAERRGADWELHYGGRNRATMAYLDQLESLGARVHVYPEDEIGLLPLDTLIGAARDDTLIYCCGPTPLLDAVERASVGWPAGALHIEHFKPLELDAGIEQPVEVTLDRSGLTVQVPSDRTLLEALNEAGANLGSSCEVGTCGTCEVTVLSGIPDHRDSVLTPEERAENAYMLPCVSRALTERLVLDL